MMMTRPGPLFTAIAWRAAALLFVCTMLAAELSGALDMPAGQRIAHVGNPAVPPAVPVPTAQPPANDIIAQHPLFHPSREPWVPPPTPAPSLRPVNLPPAAPAVQPLRNYTLTGLVLSGVTRSALIRAANGNKTIVLREGQILDGWTLKGIGSDGLHFEASGSQFDLRFPIAPKIVSR
jgi:hypothetical protein